MRNLITILVVVLGMIAFTSCKKEDISDDTWVVEAPYGTVTVTGDGLPETKIEKGDSKTFYKYLYTYIDVSCDNCGFKVNNKDYGISTRFYDYGGERPF